LTGGLLGRASTWRPATPIGLRIASLAIGLATLALLMAVLARETDGLRALTSAALPAVKAQAHPSLHASLHSADGAALDRLPGDGSLRVVEITYERCRTICSIQGSALSDVFGAFPEALASGRLRFVSLSVDPDDCAGALTQRVQRLAGGRAGWQGVCVADAAALARLHRHLGVVAVRDALGEYRHTGGVYLVDAAGHVLSHEAALDKQTLALAVQSALRRE
jgi:cytochrome oxidase Cu insertion factor (SCO1/SenC/PrrC family)